MRVNLASGSSREQLIRSLRNADKSVDWDTVVKSACIKTLRMQREGTPVVDLSKVPRPTEPVYTLEKILQAGQFSILYGEKESGKSLCALTGAVAVAEGNDALLNLRTEPAPVYLMDWETDEETQAIRLAGIMEGLGMREPPAIHYRRMERPMLAPPRRTATASRIPEVGQEVLLYIVESFGMYGGGETLYGFLSPNEKAMFLAFKDNISGTGAKKALEHLEKASKSLPDFRRAIIEKDVKILSGVFGL